MQSDQILDVAIRAHRAGLCVLPPNEDGSKAPAGRWAEYQRRKSTEEEIRDWYTAGHTGLGFVCGPISGDLSPSLFVTTGTPPMCTSRLGRKAKNSWLSWRWTGSSFSVRNGV